MQNLHPYFTVENINNLLNQYKSSDKNIYLCCVSPIFKKLFTKSKKFLRQIKSLAAVFLKENTYYFPVSVGRKDVLFDTWANIQRKEIRLQFLEWLIAYLQNNKSNNNQ